MAACRDFTLNRYVSCVGVKKGEQAMMNWEMSQGSIYDDIEIRFTTPFKCYWILKFSRECQGEGKFYQTKN